MVRLAWCGLSAVSLRCWKELQQHMQTGCLVKQEFASERGGLLAEKGINNERSEELRDLFCFVMWLQIQHAAVQYANCKRQRLQNKYQVHTKSWSNTYISKFCLEIYFRSKTHTSKQKLIWGFCTGSYWAVILGLKLNIKHLKLKIKHWTFFSNIIRMKFCGVKIHV